jgi:hypothetical protein
LILIVPLVLSILLYIVIQTKQQQQWWHSNDRNNYKNEDFINYYIPFGVIVIIAYISDTIYRIIHHFIVTVTLIGIQFQQQLLKITTQPNSMTSSMPVPVSSSSSSSSNNTIVPNKTYYDTPLLFTINIFIKCCTIWIFVWIILVSIVHINSQLYHLIWFWLFDVLCCFCLGSFLIIYSLSMYLFFIIVEIQCNINMNKDNVKSDLHLQQQQQQLIIVHLLEQQIQYIVLIVPIVLVVSWGELVTIVKGYIGYTSPIATVPVSVLLLWCLPIVSKLLYSLYFVQFVTTTLTTTTNGCSDATNSASSMTSVSDAGTSIESRKHDKFQWLIGICYKFVVIVIIWQCWIVMYFVRGPWNGIHVYHPITQLILLLSFIDCLQMLLLLWPHENQHRIMQKKLNKKHKL